MSAPSIDELVEGVLEGNRTRLGQALTLVESRRPEHQATAQEMLSRLAERCPETSRKPAVRVGISGLPGAGKSTLIESLGRWLIDERDHRVAVLAVDPTSSQTHGSILGDKTRMTVLSNHPDAFVRPSPSGGALGGVSGRTQEAMSLLEVAGFDVLLVETVGVGQSEAAVAAMVDTFVVLLVPGTGDELQGIKRGILELVHLLVINKADGESLPAAERARRDYALALHLLRSDGVAWQPRVLTASALDGSGLEELWNNICDHRRHLDESGALSQRRVEQRVEWMWRLVEEGIVERVRAQLRGDRDHAGLEEAVRAGEREPASAAQEILRRRQT